MTTIRQVPVKRRLNPVEAAEYLGVKPGTLKKWRYDRRIPYYQLGWRTIVYDVQDLDRYWRRTGWKRWIVITVRAGSAIL